MCVSVVGDSWVDYEAEEAAQAAISQVDGKMLRDKMVFVGKLKSKRGEASMPKHKR